MKIPVKITPDRIRDSIVQVFFQADMPFEPLVGICYTELQKDGWRYANRPIPSKPGTGLIIEFQAAPQHFFIKDRIKIQLNPDSSLVFNCISQYIGCNQYSKNIYSVLSQIFSTGRFKMFTRIGIRYVSEFANTDILSNINFQYELGGVTGTVNQMSFRISLEENGLIKNINIANKLPVYAAISKDQEVTFISLIDIDVVDTAISVSDFNKLIENIERVHFEEKKVFFGMLKEHFLQSLNPEYT